MVRRAGRPLGDLSLIRAGAGLRLIPITLIITAASPSPQTCLSRPRFWCKRSAFRAEIVDMGAIERSRTGWSCGREAAPPADAGKGRMPSALGLGFGLELWPRG